MIFTNIFHLKNFIDNFLTSLDIILILTLNQTTRNQSDINITEPVLDEGVLEKMRENEGFMSNEIVNFSNDLIFESRTRIINGIQSINELLNEIISQAQSGVNVYQNFASFVESNVSVTYCQNDEPLYKMSQMRSIYGYAIYLLTQLRTLLHKSSSSWIQQTELCEVIMGYFQFY